MINIKMDFKLCMILTLGLFLVMAIQDTQAKRKRSYSQVEYNLMSNERLCKLRKCGKRPKGSWCQVVSNENGDIRPECICPKSCAGEQNDTVCSVFGRQYDNECLLHVEGCRKKKNIKVAYRGPCIASQKKCQEKELLQFPIRLLDWFVHLKDTDEFGTLNPRKSIVSIGIHERKDIAEWKFKHLDINKDHKLTRRELNRFRYALMPMEHCAKDFFRKCDSDSNKKVEAVEWNNCLVDNSWYTSRRANYAQTI